MQFYHLTIHALMVQTDVSVYTWWNIGRLCYTKRSESFDGWGPQEVAALFDNFSHSTQPQGDKPPEI